MKKLISVLLAVSALALSTSAFAAGRNNAEFGNGTPVFRPGDIVSFMGGTPGTKLTLISSKVGETADNSTIQFVNEATGGTVSYKVRDLDKQGEYNILVKDGAAEVVTWNYIVAEPTVALAKLSAEATDNVILKDGDTVYFAAQASIGEGLSFADAGVEVSFKFDGKLAPVSFDGEELDDLVGEIGGAKNVVYTIGLTGAPENVAVEAYIND